MAAQTQSQAITLAVLKAWAAANPHKDKILTKASYTTPQHNNYVMDTYKFSYGQNTDGTRAPWSMITLDPPGLLSFALWIRDPLYKAGEGLLRRQLLNEGYISMRADIERMSAPRRRKCMVRLFENGTQDAEPADIRAYWETWASILSCQFVRISSRIGKRISFVPANVTEWSTSLPIYYVDENMETIFLPPTHGSVERRGLAQWVADREGEGWQVEWPTITGTKEELEAQILPLINILSVPEKAKKAELGLLLGRHNAVVALHKLSKTEAVTLDDY
jgi:hypothetical protein